MYNLTRDKKQPFKVGINEGVIFKRTDLKNILPYTSGLSGCTALVLVNDDFVFMAHVTSLISNKDKTQIKPGKYLQNIINWLKNNGSGEIQPTLVSNKLIDGGLGTATSESFLDSKVGYDIELDANAYSSDFCMVNFDKRGGLRVNTDHSTLLNLPTFSTLDTKTGAKFVVHRIDPDKYGYPVVELKSSHDDESEPDTSSESASKHLRG